jgi:D-alanine--poly(phosphoribitol) ligase subunit 1
MTSSLHQFFFDTAAATPANPALCVEGRTLSYGELARAAGNVRTRLDDECRQAGIEPGQPCLLFASRSVGAYTGLLGILAAGMAYVPLNPKFPAERNAAMIGRSGAKIMLVDAKCSEQLDALLPLLADDIRVVSIDAAIATESRPEADAYERPDASAVAYILFTSGTTGIPKGVCISHASARAYIESQIGFNPPMPEARYSQISDLTFDPSVHDMFVCWGNGGCLHVPASLDTLYLVEFIKQHRITHWFSVPSIGSFMQQFRKLRENAYPSLRMSIFGGEALPTNLVKAWAVAAPQSRIVNVYGPTEATVACLRFEVTEDFLKHADFGVVPLGDGWNGQETVVVDDKLQPVAPGIRGELLLGGTQLATRYLSDKKTDHEKFFSRRYPGRVGERWYRSGDLVRASVSNGMMFHGRVDTQIKLRGGYRVELQEVEDVVQKASGAALTCVVAWPRDASGTPEGFVAFLLNPQAADAQTLAECKRRLPVYAVPGKVIVLDELPLNVNGKVDRNQLVGMLDSREHESVVTHAR